MVGHHDQRRGEHEQAPCTDEQGSLQTIANLALQKFTVKAEVCLLVPRYLPEYGTEFAGGQAPGQQLVVTNADDLGGEQHHDLEPEPDEPPTEDKKSCGPVATNQLAAQCADTAGEQLRVAVLLSHEQGHGVSVAFVDLANPAPPCLPDDATATRFAELENGE